MKICFVALNIYPCISRKAIIDTIGGAELQQTFIGKGLREKGYDVSYVSLDHGQPDIENIEGLKIYKSFKPNEGIYRVRFFYPRLYKIWKALKRAEADLYYVRCATFLPGVLAIFCKIYGKRFVFAGAHDTDFIPNKFRFLTKRDKIFYKCGLRHADAIIVQSNVQNNLLWRNFGLKGHMIRNFYPYNETSFSDSERKYILWVSTIRTWKRPIQFIRLAESFPDENFVMIGGRSSIRNRDLYDEIEQRGKKVKNLKFLGFQPLEITEGYFDKCKIFVNTSEYEGFPNTFLQSWSRGIPVISYVDPDRVVQTNRLGIVVRSERHLHTALSTFLSYPSWDRGAILDYFRQNHSAKILDQYCSLFDEL